MDPVVALGLGYGILIVTQCVCTCKFHHDIMQLYHRTEQLAKRRYICRQNPTNITVVTLEDPT